MEGLELVITSPEQILDALAAASQSSEQVLTFRISRKACDQFSLRMQALNSLISTQSKESLEKLEQLSGTSSTTDDTWTHVRRAICTLAWQDSFGQEWLGQASLIKIERSPSNIIIDIILDDSCVRRLVTALTTAERHRPFHKKLRLRLD